MSLIVSANDPLYANTPMKYVSNIFTLGEPGRSIRSFWEFYTGYALNMELRIPY